MTTETILKDLARLTDEARTTYLARRVAALEESELSFRRLWDAEKKETARLQTAVEMRGTVIAQAQATIAGLRAALKPFADLSSVYVRRAETFGWKDADGVFGAADITKDVTIRVGDCRAALKALGEEA